MGDVSPASSSLVARRRRPRSGHNTHSTTQRVLSTSAESTPDFWPVESTPRVLRARRRLVDHLQQQGRRLRPGARVDAVDAEEGHA